MAKGEIKPIENEDSRQICFSKRRQSLFNKASELSILCGAMVGSVVFSAFGTSFSFGHPSIDEVANRFLNSVTPDGPASSGASNNNTWAAADTIHRLNMEYSELIQSLDSENKKRKMLQEATENEMGERMMQLLNANISGLGLDELQDFQKLLEAIHGVVEEKDNQMLVETSQTQGLVPQPAMKIAPDLQYQFGDEDISASPMAFTPSSSNDDFVDGLFAVDDALLNCDLDDVSGPGNSPDNQNDG